MGFAISVTAGVMGLSASAVVCAPEGFPSVVVKFDASAVVFNMLLYLLLLLPLLLSLSPSLSLMIVMLLLVFVPPPL